MAYENYQGNADLGVGAGIGVGSNPGSFARAEKAIDNGFESNERLQAQRLALLGDTESKIASADMAYNVNMFRQKVADRDYMFNQFLSGAAKVDDYIESDGTALAAARKEYDNAYENWSKNINDRNAAKAFKGATDKQADIAARMALRKRTKDEQEKALSAMAPGEDKDAMQANLDKWLKATDENGKPAMPTTWQKLKGFFQEDFKGQAVTTVKNVTSDDGLYTTPITLFDYEKTFDNIIKNSAEGNKAAKSNQYIHAYWDRLSPQQQEFLLQESKKETEAYLAANPDSKVTPIQAQPIGKDANGNTIYGLTDDVPNLTAKWLLLSNPATSGEQKFNDKVGKYKIDMIRAKTDAFYKKQMGGAAATKAGAYAANVRSQIAARESTEEKDAFLDELYSHNLIQQKSLIQSVGKGNTVFKNIEAQNSLPLFTLDGKNVKILQPIGGKPVYDKYSEDDDTKPAKNAKVLYYEGGHYEPSYLLNGKNTSIQEFGDIYKNFKSIQGKKWTGGFDDFLKMGIESGDFQVLLKGANGTTDQKLSRAAQMIISNSNTKKDQEGVFDIPTEDQVSDE